MTRHPEQTTISFIHILFPVVIKEDSFCGDHVTSSFNHTSPLSKLFSDIIINFTKIKPDLWWREMGYLNTTIMNVNVM